MGHGPTSFPSGHTEPGCLPPAHQAGVSLHQEVRHISASEVLDHLPQASHGLWWWRPPSSHWAVRQQAAYSRLAALAGWGRRLWSPVAAGQDAGHIRRDLRDGEVAGHGVCALESPVESGRAVGAGRGCEQTQTPHPNKAMEACSPQPEGDKGKGTRRETEAEPGGKLRECRGGGVGDRQGKLLGLASPGSSALHTGVLQPSLPQQSLQQLHPVGVPRGVLTVE